MLIVPQRGLVLSHSPFWCRNARHGRLLEWFSRFLMRELRGKREGEGYNIVGSMEKRKGQDKSPCSTSHDDLGQDQQWCCIPMAAEASVMGLRGQGIVAQGWKGSAPYQTSGWTQNRVLVKNVSVKRTKRNFDNVLWGLVRMVLCNELGFCP